MLDVIKKEAEYKQHLSFRKSEKFVDYFAVMKNVVEDSSTVKPSETIATNTKTEDSKNIEILEKPKEIKDTEKSEKVLEKQETTVENKAQVIEEPKKEDIKEEVEKKEVKTEELKKEEPKKEEVKKLNRKYSEEVIRKSLGLGVKLKSKTK